MTPVERWIEAHPTFVRMYVPAVVTVTFLLVVWEVTR